MTRPSRDEFSILEILIALKPLLHFLPCGRISVGDFHYVFHFRREFPS